MTKPTVSICIPTYNRPVLVEQAIRSCLAQTYQDFEIVISDNSTNNESDLIVQQIRSPKIRYYRNPDNLGSFQNLTMAVERAQGRYIKLLMDDDLMKPRSLERCVAAFELHPSVGVVMAPLDIIDMRGQSISPVFYLIKRMRRLYEYSDRDTLFRGRDILRDFLTRCYPCCVPSGLMYHHDCFDILGTFAPEFDFAVDVEICMRFATKYDFFYIHEPLNTWRYDPGSHTVRLHTSGFENRLFYLLAEHYLTQDNVLELYPASDHAHLIRNSYYFASKRCVLSIIAGLRSANWRLITNAVKEINTRDPYTSNKLRLPFGLMQECLTSVISWLSPHQIGCA